MTRNQTKPVLQDVSNACGIRSDHLFPCGPHSEERHDVRLIQRRLRSQFHGSLIQRAADREEDLIGMPGKRLVALQTGFGLKVNDRVHAMRIDKIQNRLIHNEFSVQIEHIPFLRRQTTSQFGLGQRPHDSDLGVKPETSHVVVDPDFIAVSYPHVKTHLLQESGRHGHRPLELLEKRQKRSRLDILNEAAFTQDDIPRNVKNRIFSLTTEPRRFECQRILLIGCSLDIILKQSEIHALQSARSMDEIPRRPNSTLTLPKKQAIEYYGIPVESHVDRPMREGLIHEFRTECDAFHPDGSGHIGGGFQSFDIQRGLASSIHPIHARCESAYHREPKVPKGHPESQRIRSQPADAAENLLARHRKMDIRFPCPPLVCFQTPPQAERDLLHHAV